MNKSKDGMSIVVPFLDEEEGIDLFCSAIDDYAGGLLFPIEIVFVNDGSTDDTVSKISAFEFNNIKSVKVVNLSKNYGSHAAIRAGLTEAKYDICTWLGSDLQEPLELLDISYKKIQDEGYDAVYVEKKSVGVSRVNRGFSKTYSRLMRKYAVSNYSNGGTSTIVFNGKIKKFLNENIEGNSSIMLQIMNAGYKYFSIAMDYGERAAGVSKWTLSKKIKLFIDSFVAFSYMPIRLVSVMGVVFFVLGILFGIVTIVNKVANPEVPIGYSSLATIVSLGFGVTNIALGIIAEYLWRTYDAARKRPVFLVSEVLTIKENIDV